MWRSLRCGWSCAGRVCRWDSPGCPLSDRQLRQVLKRTHRQQERITEALEALAPLPGLLA